MQYWLKALGTSENHLRQKWLTVRAHRDALEGFACPKDRRPSFGRGDRVVYYAAGWQKIFAVVEVTKEAVDDPDWKSWQGDRWTWVVKVQPLLVVPDLKFAPHVGMAAVNTLSLRNKSHIKLSPEQFWHALMSITGVAGISSNGAR
jgi:EVE domain